MTKRILNNVLYNWLGMGFNLILGFIQAPIVVIGLGNTWYGIWVLINQLTGYAWLFDLGIREAVIRYVSKNHHQKKFDEINIIVSSAIYLYILISFITIIAISIVVLLLPYLFDLNDNVVFEARIVMFIVGCNIAINWFFNAYTGILMGLQRFDIFQKIGIFSGIISFVLIIIFIKLGYGIITLSLIGFSMSMISNGFVYYNSKKLLPEFKLLPFSKNIINFGPLINYGKFVLLNNIATKVVFGTDVLIIGIFLPVSSITFYAIPGMLVNYLRNLVSTAAYVLSPVASEFELDKNIEKIYNLLTKGTTISLLLGLPIGIVFIFMGENFISLWVGDEYGNRSNLVLSILTIGTVFALGQYVFNAILYGLSRHNIIAYVRAAEAFANITLTITLIQYYGIVGVALGMAISHLVFMAIVLPVIVCRSLKYSVVGYFKMSFIRPIISILPFSLLVFWTNRYFPSSHLFEFFSKIFLIMPIYLVSTWLISLTNEEKMHIKYFIDRYCLSWFSTKRD